MQRSSRPVLIALLAACGGPTAEPAPAPAPRAPQASETAAFVVTMGVDTLSAERFTIDGSRLVGEAFTRSPRAVSRTYEAELRPDGSIARMQVTARTLTAPPATPATVTSIEFGRDSANVRITRGDSVVNQRVPAAYGAVPFIGGSYAIYEVAMRHLRRTGRRAADFALLVPGARPLSARVELDQDTGFVSNIAGRARVRTDAAGRLLELDAAETTQKVRVQRLPDVDIAALATRFARQEASGRGLGVLSPRDSAVLELGGARIVVDYGRPSLRGRQLMGELVAYDEVWRTGANAATGFRTTRDLMVGSAHVPAGAYTLWTLPSRAGWKLIINRQTGQWGTEYHVEQDLARLDLERRTAATPVETFTIALQATGPRTGVLRLAWGDVELSAPIVVH